MRFPTSGTAAVIAYRLGGTDGVSIEAAKWIWALGELGFELRTVAGEGRADRLVPGLAIGAGPSDESELAEEVRGAVDGADVVVVENVCSLPLNPGAGRSVAAALEARPAILRHHDLPWQRTKLAHLGGPPTDAAWRHVCINERSQRELGARSIGATTFYNCFDPDPAPGDRDATRHALGVSDNETLVLQPTRAIPRKNVAGGIRIASALGATYWLLGPAEDGYGPELDRILAAAPVPVLRGPASPAATIEDAYSACDVVALPSTFEGFGNPSIESALRLRPLAVGRYPVATELRHLGFRWFDIDDLKALRHFLDAPEPRLLEHNRLVARQAFSLTGLPERLSAWLAADL